MGCERGVGTEMGIREREKRGVRLRGTGGGERGEGGGVS